jgi:hypothetical protein
MWCRKDIPEHVPPENTQHIVAELPNPIRGSNNTLTELLPLWRVKFSAAHQISAVPSASSLTMSLWCSG